MKCWSWIQAIQNIRFFLSKSRMINWSSSINFYEWNNLNYWILKGFTTNVIKNLWFENYVRKTNNLQSKSYDRNLNHGIEDIMGLFKLSQELLIKLGKWINHFLDLFQIYISVYLISKFDQKIIWNYPLNPLYSQYHYLRIYSL